MRMKLIVALIDNDKTDTVIEAARAGGATGATVVTNCRGEGLHPAKTFLGLDISTARDIALFLVVDTMARDILERIGAAARVDEEGGAGVAFQIAIEDAVGLTTQLPVLREELETSYE